VQQVKELQAKISECRSKIAAIDTITGRSNTNQENESHVAEPKDANTDSGEFTPVFAYWRPILEVLVEMGGSGQRLKVIGAVGEKMKGILKPADYGKLPKSGWKRWSNRVVWQASNMRQPEQGLIKNDSPRGIWEITDAGRKWLDDNKT
jgi:Mrr N-terminal domain